MFALHKVCADVDAAYIFDSVQGREGLRLAPQRMTSVKLVIVPMNILNIHWVLLLVWVETMDVTLYDPFDDLNNHNVMQEKWHTAVLPFLQQWWR